ncbi:hypothetical protein EV424DRAFT_1344748 [Suillus variegatus]|nr:hypothetical protein EV424DRAFT_1344748 [Suillus variegatus]
MDAEKPAYLSNILGTITAPNLRHLAVHDDSLTWKKGSLIKFSSPVFFLRQDESDECLLLQYHITSLPSFIYMPGMCVWIAVHGTCKTQLKRMSHSSAAAVVTGQLRVDMTTCLNKSKASIEQCLACSLVKPTKTNNVILDLPNGPNETASI